MIRVANGQGFRGDWLRVAAHLGAPNFLLGMEIETDE